MSDILDEEYVGKKKIKRGPAFYVLLVLLITGSIFATIHSWYNLKGIVYSGPIMSIIGIIFSFISRHERNRVGLILGLIPVAATAFWLAVINIYKLSPKDCEVIIPVVMIVGSVVILANAVYMLSRNYKN